MTRAQVARRFAGVVMMMSIATGALLASRADARASAEIAAPAIAKSSSAGRSHAAEPGISPDNDEGVTDLYGNDVTSAVANYRLDVDGSLYEAHSPRTQLPRLGSPKS